MPREKNIPDAAFVERMNILAKAAGSVNALATTTGISQSTIRRYFEGGEPGRPQIVQIAKSCKVSTDWLTTGEGSGPGENREIAPTSNYTPVNLYDVHGSAGHGAYVGNEEVSHVVAFRESWLRSELNCDPTHLSMIFVTGDSMEPTLYSGDVVLIDHSTVDNITDAIWVIGIEEGPLIKRVQRLPGGKVKIISDNKTYETWDVDLENMPDGMRFIGRVVWSGRRM